VTTAIAPHHDHGPDDPEWIDAVVALLAPDLDEAARRIAGYRSAADLTRDTVPAGLCPSLADELPPVGTDGWVDSQTVSGGRMEGRTDA
jgi:hypothetical protein